MVDASKGFDDFEETRPVTTRVEAMEQLMHRTVTISPFTAAFEDGERFYFSGGYVPEPVEDFSIGVAVRKSDGRTVHWSKEWFERTAKPRPEESTP